MGISHSLDFLDRPSVARRTERDAPAPWSTAWVAEVTGATFRQVDWWVRHGLLGDDLQGVGQGQRRRFTPAQVEAVTALAELAALGCRDRWLAAAADAVLERRVAPAGEWLVVPLEGSPQRRPIGAVGAVTGACWMVPLWPCTASPAGAPLDRTASPRPGIDRGVA